MTVIKGFNISQRLNATPGVNGALPDSLDKAELNQQTNGLGSLNFHGGLRSYFAPVEAAKMHPKGSTSSPNVLHYEVSEIKPMLLQPPKHIRRAVPQRDHRQEGAAHF